MSDHAGTATAENAVLRARRVEILHECEQLESERDKYRDLYDSAPDMYGLLDGETATILECNDAMVRNFGYERHEIIGKHFFDFHPPYIHERMMGLIEQFRETGELPDVEVEFLHKDGTRSPASSKVSPIRDETGRIVRARSVLRDITQYKQAEVALKQSEERFHLLAETISAVPWELRFDLAEVENLDSAGDQVSQVPVFYVGPQCERVLGYTHEQYMEPGFWLEVLHPDDRALVQSRFAELLVRGGAGSVECRYLHGNGRTIWVFTPCAVVRHQDGTSSLTGVTIDITDQKSGSDRRLRVMRELDHRVKNTLTVVEAMADRTRETAASFSEFTSLLSSRVGALARIHAALSKQDWLGLTMDDLVSAACRKEPRLQVIGPPLSLPLEIAQPLGMALRELATNARTHGALSKESGTVSLRWTTERSEAKQVLNIAWAERDGPPVRATQTRGCGRYLIEDVLAYNVDAEVEMSFPRSGLCCTIAIPLPRS